MGSTRALKYISKMRGVLYYTRSIPKDVQALDPRPGPIQKSLKTKNLDIAMSRRDSLAEADDRYWRSLRALKIANQSSERLASVGDDLIGLLGTESVGLDLPSLPKGRAGLTLQEFYQKQAEDIFSGPEEGMMERFSYWLTGLPTDVAEHYRKIVSNTQIIGPVARKFEDASQIVGASMGLYKDAHDEPMKMSEAIEDFFQKFAVAHMANMSPSQIKNFKNPKKRAMKRFIDLLGDVPLQSITREQAVRFKDHWLARIHNPSEGEKPLTRAGAVRELQDLQFIWQSYADEYQWTDRFGRLKDNPFHDLKKHFPAPPKTSVCDGTEARVTFSTNIIREKWLQNDGLKGTNEELRCVLYTLVETGCNPLELLHLTAEKIHLDHSTPHILIQPSAVGVNRNIVKNNARVRARFPSSASHWLL